MPKRITEEQRVKLAKLLILMKVPKEESLDIMTAIETIPELRLFLEKLSEKSFDMTPQEVHQSLIDTLIETGL